VLPEPYQDLVPFGEFLERRSCEPGLLESRARLVEGQLFLEAELHRGAAHEVDAQVRLAPADLHQGEEAQGDHDGRDSERDVLPSHEIDIVLCRICSIAPSKLRSEF